MADDGAFAVVEAVDCSRAPGFLTALSARLK